MLGYEVNFLLKLNILCYNVLIGSTTTNIQHQLVPRCEHIQCNTRLWTLAVSLDLQSSPPLAICVPGLQLQFAVEEESSIQQNRSNLLVRPAIAFCGILSSCCQMYADLQLFNHWLENLKTLENKKKNLTQILKIHFLLSKMVKL